MALQLALLGCDIDFLRPMNCIGIVYDSSKIPFLHTGTVYVPVYVLLVLVRVHIRYSFIDCMIPVLVV